LPFISLVVSAQKKQHAVFNGTVLLISSKVWAIKAEFDDQVANENKSFVTSISLGYPVF
jgi:hypothetical protein